MSEWQPIETAKQGKAIVFDSKIGVITNAVIYVSKNGITVRYGGYYSNDAYDVTHWMPLPPPPTTESM
jgi:hypothetical protein